VEHLFSQVNKGGNQNWMFKAIIGYR
jgi:hypothetical protein